MTDPHLDDEQLSLLLDGVDVDGRAHAADGGCGRCAARLSSLRAARDAVAAASVPPLPEDSLDRLVAAALDAPAGAGVVRLDPVRHRRRWTTPPPAWLVGAAAGIAVLVGIAGVFRAVDLSGSRRDAGLAVTADEESTSGGADAATNDLAASGATTGAPVAADPEAVIADLADQDDPAALTRALDGLTAMRATTTAGAMSPSSATGGAASTDAMTAESERAATSAPTPTSTTIVAANRAQCRARADGIGAGRFAELLSTATLRWKGRPAEVLVFRLARPPTPDTPESRQALVLSRPGCELLADVRF